MNQKISNFHYEDFFKPVSLSKDDYFAHIKTVNKIVIFLNHLNISTINNNVLSGCSRKLPHHNEKVIIYIHYQRTKESVNPWIDCYNNFIIIGRNKQNKRIVFAPGTNFVNLNIEIKSDETKQKTHYLVVSNENSKLINRYKDFVSGQIKLFLQEIRIIFEKKNHEDKYNSLLIKLNISDNFIEFFLVSFCIINSDIDLSKDKLRNIYYIIINRFKFFFSRLELNYICDTFINHDYISYLKLKEAFEIMNFNPENFIQLIDVLEKRKKKITPDNVVEIDFVNKLLNVIINHKSYNLKTINTLENLENLRGLTLKSEKIKKEKLNYINKINDYAKSQKIDLLKREFISFQNNFQFFGDFDFHLMKLYILVKCCFNNKTHPTIQTLRAIDELTDFSLNNIFQILSLPKNNYRFLYELLQINFLSLLIENALMIGLILRSCIASNQTVLSQLTDRILVLIVSNFAKEWENFHEKFNKFPVLKYFEKEIICLLNTLIDQKKDKLIINDFTLNSLNQKSQPSNKLDFVNINLTDDQFIFKVIKSTPVIENNTLTSNDIIFTNDIRITYYFREFSNTSIFESESNYKRLKLNNLILINYFSSGLTKEKISNVSLFINESRLDNKRNILSKRTLIELKSKFPSDDDFYNYINKISK